MFDIPSVGTASGGSASPAPEAGARALPLVAGDNSVLRTPSREFDFAAPPCDPAEFARVLTETMLSHRGLGLSACQVGHPYRVFVLRTNPVLAIFNPRIVDQSTDLVLLDEGCLSFPGLVVKVKRSSSCRVRFQMPNGETVTKPFEGITARCVLHEVDHLDGVLFFDRASRFHREQGMRQWAAWKRRRKK